MRTVQPYFPFASTQYQNNKKAPLASSIHKAPHFGAGEKFTVAADGTVKADDFTLQWHKDKEIPGYLYKIDEGRIGFQPVNIPVHMELVQPKPGDNVRVTRNYFDRLVRASEFDDGARSSARPRTQESGDRYSPSHSRAHGERSEDEDFADSEDDIPEKRKALRSSAGDTSLIRYRKESPSPVQFPNRIWQSAR